MSAHRNLSNLTTESSNPRSVAIDSLDALEIVRLINREDLLVAEAVGRAEQSIARAVDAVAESFRTGGRLIYFGAGTSGRLGVLDASECPPTFNSPPELVVGLIAGGDIALRRAVEGAEDNPAAAREDLQKLKLTPRDCVFGIATSGRTPYVLGGLRYAREIHSKTIGLACNAASDMGELCDIMIEVIVGPEIISGSTRMKAGTATKLVLNTITTGAMVLIGATYGNLMVDLRATNTKLQSRALRLVCMLTGLDSSTATCLLSAAEQRVKVAVVMHHRQTDCRTACHLLEQAGGQLRAVVGNVPIITPDSLD